MKPKPRFLAIGAGSLVLLLAAGVGLAVAAENETEDDAPLDAKFIGMMARNEAMHKSMEKMQSHHWGGPRGHMMPGMGLVEGENGTFSSKAVSFQADPDAGAIVDLVYTNMDGNATSLALRVTLAGDGDNATTAEFGRRGYVLAAGDAAKLMLGGMPGFHARASGPSTLSIELPAGVNVTMREAVADWSPAGVTIDYGTEKANLRLSEAATLTLDGQTLTVGLTDGGSLMFHVVRDGAMGGFGMHHGGGGRPHH